MHGLGMAVGLFVSIIGCTNSILAHEPPTSADAPLRAVTMVDQREGWAIGDEGVILHTIDGWETCERQTTHVRASLRGIHFLDAYRGYAVGVEMLPFGRGTTGVVLGTQDGGIKWEKLINKELPGLYGVRFIDAVTGYAFGDTTGGHNGGVFVTENGGRTWRSISSLTESNTWTCGAIIADQPVFAGVMGQIGAIEKENVFTLPNKRPAASSLRGMAAKDQDVWAVGSQATVMVSRQTQGKSWEPVELPLSNSLRGCLDFSAVCCHGNHVWVAGRPGSVIFHSWDRGQSWEAQRTGQPLPLHGICFAGESTGWAVGELGTILMTTDGGKNWSVRRRGGHRSALMMVTTQKQDLAVGTVAVMGGDRGYLTTALQVTHQPGQAQSDADRTLQAIRGVGGCSAEVLSSFAVADFQETMDANKLLTLFGNGDQAFGQARLEEQLVLALRMWRPSAIVCSAPVSNAAGSLNAVCSLALKNACELSSRADVYPEHFTKLDLQPWQPARLFTKRTAQSTADLVLNLDRPRPVLFASANDYANASRSMLLDKFAPGPMQEQYTLWKSWCDQTMAKNDFAAGLAPEQLKVWNKWRERTGGTDGPLTGWSPEEFVLWKKWCEFEEAREDFLTGLSLGYGGQARREKVEIDETNFRMLVQATAKQVADTEQFRQRMKNPDEAKQFFKNFERSMVGLAPTTIGDRIYAQAQEFADRGEWLMARECHLMLLDLLPTHRFSGESCRFILATMGSSEAKRRVDLRQMKTAAEYPLSAVALKLNEKDGLIDLEKSIQTKRTSLQRRRTEIRQWQKGALAAGEIMSVLDPLTYGEAQLQFCMQANQRLAGNQEVSKLLQMEFQVRQPYGIWRDAAATEQWLHQRIGKSPKPAIVVQRLASMPKIDGQLDDECWRQVGRSALVQAAGSAPESTEIMMGYDEQHLYLAVKCKQPTGDPKHRPLKPRKRDDDLRPYDRISLLLDLDRDYGTYFHFEFDQRGCVTEDCCGDLTWNPKWFIEVTPMQDGWTAEVAIPLIELTGETGLSKNTWAVNITRIMPGKGVQAMSLPAAVKPKPEGMGLLMFE